MGGSIVWSATLPALPFASYHVGPVSPAPNGNAYVSAAIVSGGQSSYALGFDQAGVKVDQVGIAGGGSGVFPPTFLGTDPLNDVLYAYAQYGTGGIANIYAAKRSPMGMSKSVGATYNDAFSTYHLSFGQQGGDCAGHWLVDVDIAPGPSCTAGNCGYTFGNGLELGHKVLRYDAAGAYLGSIPSPAAPWRLAPSGDLYVVKGFTGTTDIGCGPVTGGAGPSTLLAKLDLNGTCVWSKAFAAPAPAAFTLGGDGSILFAILHTGSIHLGGGALPDFGAQNLTIARLDLAGNVTLTRTYGGAGSTFSNVSLDAAPSGILVLAAKFGGTVDLGAGPLGNAGDTLLAAFGASGVLRWSKVVNVGTTSYFLSSSVLRMTQQPCSMVIVSNSPTVNLGAGPVVPVPPANNSADIAVVGLAL